MTNRQPRIDTDSDDRIENANLDLAQNLAQSDTLSAHPLAAADVAQLGTGIDELDAGADANKPAAGTEGRFYIAEDTNLVYYDTGTSWVAIGGAGSSGSRLPATVYRDDVDANRVFVSNELRGDTPGPEIHDDGRSDRVAYFDDQNPYGVSPPTGSNTLRLQQRPEADEGGEWTGVVLDAGADDWRGALYIAGDAGDTVFESRQGYSVNLHIGGTQSYEVQVNSSATRFDRAGSRVMSIHDGGGVDLAAIDLSALTLTATEDGRLYRHDGSNSITADGVSTSTAGYYVWNNGDSEFKAVANLDADTIGTDEIDESIAPTWTGGHTFNGGVSVEGAKLQAALDGLVVPVGSGLGVEDAIDPSNTTTPFADAISTIADGETVILPRGSITEASTLSISKAVNIKSFGQDSQVVFSDTANDAIQIASGNTFQEVVWEGFVVDGSGSRTGGHAITWNGGTKSWTVTGTMYFRGFDNSGSPVLNPSSSAPWSSNWQHIDFGDGGTNEGSWIVWGSGHPPWTIGSIYGQEPSGSVSFDTSFNDVNVHIGHLNNGGEPHQILDCRGSGDAMVTIDHIRYEPVNTNNPGALFDLRGATFVDIRQLYPSNMSAGGDIVVDEIYSLNGTSPANKRLAGARTAEVTINNAVVQVESDTGPGNLYRGPTGDCNNSSGTSPLSNDIECLPGSFSG